MDKDKILAEDFKSVMPVNSLITQSVLTLVFYLDANSRDSWKLYTYCSAKKQNREKVVKIARHSFWRKVYYGVRYRIYSTSGWTFVQNECKK